MNNKFEQAIGAFWGAALFLVATMVLISIFVFAVKVIVAITIGVVFFLALGLIIQGIITLCKKDS